MDPRRVPAPDHEELQHVQAADPAPDPEIPVVGVWRRPHLDSQVETLHGGAMWAKVELSTRGHATITAPFPGNRRSIVTKNVSIFV